MKKKLLESFEAKLAINPTINLAVDKMVAEWGAAPYAELSVLLVWLRYLQVANQTHHWISKGQNSYADHLLFQRLYEEIFAQIDSLAEKLVGLGSEANVHLELQTSQLDRLARECANCATTVDSNQLAKKSLELEFNFLKSLDYVKELLNQKGQLTLGLDNMLAGLADVHESYVFLLKQRCSA